MREILQGNIAPTLREDGCLRYDLFVDLADPGKFTFIEEWTSTDRLEKHRTSSHMNAGRVRMGEFLREPVWVQALQRLR